MTFFPCHGVLDPSPFIEMCEEELCKCNLTDRLDCACSAFTQYSRACARNKAAVQWRTNDLCRKFNLVSFVNFQKSLEVLKRSSNFKDDFCRSSPTEINFRLRRSSQTL